MVIYNEISASSIAIWLIKTLAFETMERFYKRIDSKRMKAIVRNVINVIEMENIRDCLGNIEGIIHLPLMRVIFVTLFFWQKFNGCKQNNNVYNEFEKNFSDRKISTLMLAMFQKHFTFLIDPKKVSKSWRNMEFIP